MESNILFGFFNISIDRIDDPVFCRLRISVLWIWMTWRGEVCTWVTFPFMTPPVTLCYWESSFARSISWPRSWRSWPTICSTRSEPWRMRRRRQTGQSSVEGRFHHWRKIEKVIATLYLAILTVKSIADDVMWKLWIVTFFLELHDINSQLRDLKSDLWDINLQKSNSEQKNCDCCYLAILVIHSCDFISCDLYFITPNCMFTSCNSEKSQEKKYWGEKSKGKKNCKM